MIDGSVLQSTQRFFEKKSRVVVKMVVRPLNSFSTRFYTIDMQYVAVNNWFIRQNESKEVWRVRKMRKSALQTSQVFHISMKHS